MTKTQEWAVTIEASTEKAVTDDAIDAVVEALPASAHGSIAASRHTISMTITVAGPRLPSAAVKEGERIALEAVRSALDVGRVDLVQAEAMTVEEQERLLREPNFPELIGVAELAEILKVSRQRASELARLDSFPRPVTWLSSGPIWIRSSVSNFVQHWPRKPGRPRKDATVVAVTATAKAKAGAHAVLTPDGASGPEVSGAARTPVRSRRGVPAGD